MQHGQTTDQAWIAEYAINSPNCIPLKNPSLTDEKCQQKCQQTFPAVSKMKLKKVSESGWELTLTERRIPFIITATVMI
jgi:hypothetical protein